ncbi:CLUMA_CG011797, isoform A [Clunio marinus]|uniref:CLUMA_CG011797, isoform A n=1 Tax=Clunio marinus TaxID=568069 RepID=A0A1J1IE07_9DIPT|nr:CLUMA_CG011797, isoform A [Clunio marinus]
MSLETYLRISFNKEIIQRINLPSDQNTFVNFGFCVKSIELQSLAFFVGFTRINFSDIIRSNGTFHKSCLIVNESDLKVGCFNVKLELGINELHFGKHLMDALYGHKENISISLSNNQDFVPQNKPVTLIHQNVQTQTHPSHSNDDCDADRDYGNKNLQTDKSSANKNRNNLNFDIESDEKDSQMVDVGKENSNLRTKVYRGLLFIEGLRNVKDQLQSEYFITYDGFWNECQESTESYDSFTFNYLKQFPVICDDSFLKKVQNNHLELKLWEKTSRSEKWLGSTRVPLHQFYIAFRDVAMIEHLSTNQLPIISIDTWCNFISPLSSELFCQGKVLLAIGNENQIEYFKLMRNLHNLPLPVRNKSAAVQVDSNIQIKNKLSAFIESLSQKLPEPSVTNNHFQKNSAVSSSAASSSSLSSRNQPELRKTSELLETLQKALAQPPPNVNFTTPPSAAVHQQHVESDSSSGSISQNIIKMLVSIEHATHLPEVVIKKKHNRRKNKNSSAPQRTEFEPSTYATFETSLERINENLLPENVVKSHEGFVHCTKVVKSSCDPQWNQEFNVQLPLDILMNPQKRFVVKVWRKVAQDSEMKAAPFEDAVIGFSAVDLSVLMTGLPVLSGYYNIMDFSGRCNGQIKLSFKPLDDLLQYQDSSTSLPIMQSLMHPLNIDVGSSDDGSNLLSRTLKRKFTELDEITQRLKARLFDVTGDENFDPEDEFERDLNTAVDEMDEDEGNQQDFAWLKQNPIEMQLNALLDSQPSTSKGFVEKSPILPAQREVSGCSSDNPPHMGIDQLLKKYDLDTLINPNIFKNILDPTLANSDSTPTLNPQPINVDVSGDSGDTTVSSILSNDQVQTIQKAFQKASLAEGSESSSRKDPDGENNFSE